MHYSKYSFLFYSEIAGVYLLYNSLSGFFSKIDKSIYRKLNKFKIKSDTSIFTKKELVFFENNLIIIDENEFDIYKSIAINRRNSLSSILTIAPTRDCNFKCSYCYEESRPKIYMSEKVEDDIIWFIKHKQINDLSVIWYGGEPSMHFDRVLSLSHKIKNAVNSYSATMISNGYNLSNQIISQFESINIRRLQITIDGTRQKHNVTRIHISNRGTYDMIINNIDNILNNYPNIHVVIRVNVNSSNEDDFIEIKKFLLTKYGKLNISIYAGFIRDYNGFVDTRKIPLSHCNFNRSEKVKFTKKDAKVNYGNIHNQLPFPYYTECEARHINDYIIGPEGDLYKCWEDIGVDENRIGFLKSSINDNLQKKYLFEEDPLEDVRCIDCKYLPICGGGCPVTRLRNKNFNESTNVCTIYKGNLIFFLENYYLNSLKQ